MRPRIILATLNAKYIHASLGLRYLMANMERHGSAALRAATELHEFTIHRPADEVVDKLLQTLAKTVEPESSSTPTLGTTTTTTMTQGAAAVGAIEGFDAIAVGGAKALSAVSATQAVAGGAAQGAVPIGRAGTNVHIVGFGVYIWNVTETLEVVRQLKARRPDIKVVLGGPEVSHETQDQAIVALADYVITGWGDVSFPRLCHALVQGPRPLNKIIAGEQPPLDQIALPYDEYDAADLAHRVLYVEASRGCPYRCAFCLSALDKTAWSFDLDQFLQALESLYARGARRFKFVDRTFNLKVSASARILEFFLAKLEAPARSSEQLATAALETALPDPETGDGLPGLHLHFELVPDHLPSTLKAIMARFPHGVLQFEVGIQSWDLQVQKNIQRQQNNAAAEENLRWLRQHTQAHLHTDLIFGLPGETWESFGQGFDRLWALRPHEIQLGILKRLRGTPLARQNRSGEDQQWGMHYDAHPPYAVLHTNTISAQEVQSFARIARYWDMLANAGRFPRTLEALLSGPSAFASLSGLSQWLWQHFGRTHGITPEEWVEALLLYQTGHQKMDPQAVLKLLRADYLGSGARGNPACLHLYPAPKRLPQGSLFPSDAQPSQTPQDDARPLQVQSES